MINPIPRQYGKRPIQHSDETAKYIVDKRVVGRGTICVIARQGIENIFIIINKKYDRSRIVYGKKKKAA